MDFDIEKTTGSIVIARPLDTRRGSSYNLTVEVTDGSHTIATQVRGLMGNPGGEEMGGLLGGKAALLTIVPPSTQGPPQLG